MNNFQLLKFIKRNYKKIAISTLLLISLYGCSQKTTDSETPNYTPTKTVELKGITINTNDSVFSKDQKIIATLTNNSESTGTFKVYCEPTKSSKVYSGLLDDEAGGYSYELDPGQKQKIVFKRRSIHKGKYHVIVKTAVRHESPLGTENLISNEFLLK